MRTKEIKRVFKSGVGHGRDRGDIEEIHFECPCGKGKIIEEHDDIPGFRNKGVWIDCPVCNKKYKLDTSKGVRDWEIVERGNKV